MSENRELGLIEKAYLERKLPKDIKGLPYNELTLSEREIIDKINQGRVRELSDDELNSIKKLVADYREIIKDYNVDEIIESNKLLADTVATEQELLDFVYGQEKPVIKMKLPLNGVNRIFTFTVKPLEDSRAVKMLEQHVDIFKDLSQEEREIFNKSQNGQSLNPKEEAVIKHINEKITENQSLSQIEEVTNLLAYQIEEPNGFSVEDKIEFWKRFNFLLRMQLYGKVMEKLGLTQEFNDDLFQD